MIRGFKRLSAVVWGIVALLCVLRAPIWAIRADATDSTALFYAGAVLVPLLLHLATVWILNGFARSDLGR